MVDRTGSFGYQVKLGSGGLEIERGSSSASWYCSFVWLFSKLLLGARQDTKARNCYFGSGY